MGRHDHTLRFIVAAMATINLLVLLANAVCSDGASSLPAQRGEWRPLHMNDEIRIDGVRVNSSVRFSAKFTNTSDESVEIARVTTTCGCTDIEFIPKVVPTGASGEIRGLISEKPHAGVFQVRASAVLNGVASGRNGSVSLLVTLDVAAALEVSTRKLTLKPHVGTAEQDGSGVLKVRNLLNEEQKITVSHTADLASTVPDVFSLAPHEVKELGIVAKSRQQRSDGKLLITTSTGESHRIDIAVRPTLPVVASPERLVLGVLSNGDKGLVSTQIAQVTLKGNVDVDDVEIRDLPLPLTKCFIGQEHDGLVLTFSLAESFPEKLVRGDVVLMVSTEELASAEIRIPVIGVVRDTSTRKD